MAISRFKIEAEKLLSLAGVKINGSEPWDIQVYNEDFYRRVLREGALGLGESYMEGWWDAPELDEFFHRVLRERLEDKVKFNWPLLWRFAVSKVLNQQSRRRAFAIGEKHYDTGNDLFEAMLGESMAYSCGYWRDAKNLDDAQEAKFDLICRKLGFKAGMTVLDIGCGWGTFMEYAAQKYGIRVVGTTVSKEQAEWGRARCKDLPIEIRLQDYRNLDETFDRVVSVGMFEHVGSRNYRTYMRVVHRCLKDDGLSLLHTIGGNQSTTVTDPWIAKYIFPNSHLPSITQIGAAIEGLFVMEDWHNFGAYYDRTLMAWFRNFTAHWERLKSRYDERFYRMWKYYLLSCAGSFRARRNQLWQVVLSKRGVLGGYLPVR